MRNKRRSSKSRERVIPVFPRDGFHHGKVVRAVRLGLRLSQLEFGYLLGLSIPTLSRWENEHQIPDPWRWRLCARIFVAAAFVPGWIYTLPRNRAHFDPWGAIGYIMRDLVRVEKSAPYLRLACAEEGEYILASALEALNER